MVCFCRAGREPAAATEPGRSSPARPRNSVASASPLLWAPPWRLGSGETNPFLLGLASRWQASEGVWCSPGHEPCHTFMTRLPSSRGAALRGVGAPGCCAGAPLMEGTDVWFVTVGHCRELEAETPAVDPAGGPGRTGGWGHAPGPHAPGRPPAARREKPHSVPGQGLESLPPRFRVREHVALGCVSGLGCRSHLLTPGPSSPHGDLFACARLSHSPCTQRAQPFAE